MTNTKPDVSVLIVTADRPGDLQETLYSLRDQRVPAGTRAELLVVDNSRQKSAEVQAVVEKADLPQFTFCRYARAAVPGKSRATNIGFREAQGEILLFIDDDIRPPVDWLARMAAPIQGGDADAVCGGVRFAPHLLRPWMERLHLGMFASTEWAKPGEQLPAFIGANMGFHRRVLERVPVLDIEIGPATIYGGGEEILFSFQLDKAGFKRISLLDVSVEHHFAPDRLRSDVMRTRMMRNGREHAYILYHWEHENVTHVQKNFVRSYIDLIKVQRRMKTEWTHNEGISVAEMKALEIHYMYRQYIQERKRPRNYERHGLVKQRGLLPDGTWK